MRRFVKKSGKKSGQPPGVMVHVGVARTFPTRMEAIEFDDKTIRRFTVSSVEELPSDVANGKKLWLSVSSVHNVEPISAIGRYFGLHPLVAEDIVHTGQRAKTEDYGSYLFTTLTSLQRGTETTEFVSEQISLILLPSVVISFQESEEPLFTPVMERLQLGKGRIRNAGAGYLYYALLDTVVDGGFGVLEEIDDALESLDNELTQDPGPNTLIKIRMLKRELLFLRKAIWPMRDMISWQTRVESGLIGSDLTVFLRDVYDHVVQQIDIVETFREMITGMMDTYLSTVSNRMNEVMKVLTIIATMFIPLTFLAGIYGMNFEHMPELKWTYSYPLFWVIILVLLAIMAFFFRRRKWL